MRAAGGRQEVTAEPRTGQTSGARRFRARGGAGAGVRAAPSGHSPGPSGRRGGDQAAPPRAAPAPGCRCPPWPMSSAQPRSPLLRPPKMKKDESFLGKLGGTLARKKKAREGECAGRRPAADPIPAGTTRPRARARLRGPPGPRVPARAPPRPARPAWRAAATFGTGLDPLSFLLPSRLNSRRERAASRAAARTPSRAPASLSRRRPLLLSAGLGANVSEPGYAEDSPAPAPAESPLI